MSDEAEPETIIIDDTSQEEEEDDDGYTPEESQYLPENLRDQSDAIKVRFWDIVLSHANDNPGIARMYSLRHAFTQCSGGYDQASDAAFVQTGI